MSVTGNNNIHIGNVGVAAGSKTIRIGKKKIKALAATVKEQTSQPLVTPTYFRCDHAEPVEKAQVPSDLIGARYKFRLVTNESQSLRIVFGFNYFTAPGSPIGGYEIESNVYSGTATYADGGCTTWPPLGTYTAGVASLRSATLDYPYGGGQQP